jgi:hypothetical protein
VQRLPVRGVDCRANLRRVDTVGRQRAAVPGRQSGLRRDREDLAPSRRELSVCGDARALRARCRAREASHADAANRAKVARRKGQSQPPPSEFARQSRRRSFRHSRESAISFK